jgi:ElaB/YqjD/DUF883 family membrane-anchored ribosome-binding protein
MIHHARLIMQQTGADDRNDDVRAMLRKVITESEALLAAIGEEGSERYRDAVVGLQRQIRRAQDHLDNVQYAAVRQARLAARRADHYVHENPWKTAGGAAAIGAAVGALVGVLIARR